MCLVETFKDVYPGEVQTTKIIHRCTLSDSAGLCRHTRVHDYGEKYHTQYRPTIEGNLKSSRYPVTQPAAPTKLKRPPQTTSGAPSRSRVEDRTFNLHLPCFGNIHVRQQKRRRSSRTRSRSPRPFIVDYPGEASRVTAGDMESSVSRAPWVALSAETAPPGAAQEIEPKHGLERHSRSPNIEQRPKKRRPRERTPVTEREPPKQRRPLVPVEVHDPTNADAHTPSGDDRNQAQRSGRNRQVRFAPQLHRIEFDNKSANADTAGIRRKARAAHNQRGGDMSADDSGAGNASMEYELIKKDARRRHAGQHRRPWTSSPSRRANSYRLAAQPRRDGARDKPSAIQAGRRRMSEAGSRMVEE